MAKSSSPPSKKGSTADPKQVNRRQQQITERKRELHCGTEEGGRRLAKDSEMAGTEPTSFHDRDVCIFKLQTENDSLRRRIKQVELERDLGARNYEGLAKHSAYYQHYLAQLATTAKFSEDCSSRSAFDERPRAYDLNVLTDTTQMDVSHQHSIRERTDSSIGQDYQSRVNDLTNKNTTPSVSPDLQENFDNEWRGKLSSSNSPILSSTHEVYQRLGNLSPISISGDTTVNMFQLRENSSSRHAKPTASLQASNYRRSKSQLSMENPSRLVGKCTSVQASKSSSRNRQYAHTRDYRTGKSESEDSSSESDTDDSVDLERRSSDVSTSSRSVTNASSVKSRSDSEELLYNRKQYDFQRKGSNQSSCSSPIIQAVAARLNKVDMSSSRRGSDSPSVQGPLQNVVALDSPSITSSRLQNIKRTESRSPEENANATRRGSATASLAKRGRSAIHRDEETDSDLKAAIRESYANFKLDGKRLKFTYEPQPLDPNAINLNTNWKWRSKLNEATVKKLLTAGGEISAFLPESDDKKAIKREVELIKRLCNSVSSKHSYSSLREIVDALRREREVTRDELNLVEFELYSTLIVMKHQNEKEFVDTVKGFSDYQGDLLGMYYSLNMFLSHLDRSWEGLQLLVLVYLLRAGVGRLLKYLVATTRPAAIELLLRRFGESRVIAKKRQMIGKLIEISGENCSSRLQQVTPLKRLQDRMSSVTAPAVVSAALGYNDPYHIPHEPYTGEEFHNLEATTSNESRVLLPSLLHEPISVHENLESLSTIKPVTSSMCAVEHPSSRKSICLDEEQSLSPRKRQRSDPMLACETELGIITDTTYTALDELSQSGWLIKDLQMLGPEAFDNSPELAVPQNSCGQMTGWTKIRSQDDSGFYSTTSAVANQAQFCEEPMSTLAEIHQTTNTGPLSSQVPPLCMSSQFRADEGSMHDASGDFTFSPLTALHHFDDVSALQQCDESMNQDLDWHSWGVSFPSDFFDSTVEGTVDPRVLGKMI